MRPSIRSSRPSVCLSVSVRHLRPVAVHHPCQCIHRLPVEQQIEPQQIRRPEAKPDTVQFRRCSDLTLFKTTVAPTCGSPRVAGASQHVAGRPTARWKDICANAAPFQHPAVPLRIKKPVLMISKKNGIKHRFLFFLSTCGMYAYKHKVTAPGVSRRVGHLVCVWVQFSHL
jgi:hypothetical protein